MCRFPYSEYEACHCGLYDEHAEYCTEWLEPYSYYHPSRSDRPPWQVTLIVRETDEYGVLDDYDNGIHYMTLPSNPAERLKKVGCVHSKFGQRTTRPNGECPYHGPGGLKNGWDAMLRDRSNGFEKLREQREGKRKEHIEAEKQRNKKAVEVWKNAQRQSKLKSRW